MDAPYSDATIIAAQSIYAEKFIAPEGSNNWSKQGLLIKTGTNFDYLLKITNETKTEYSDLVVYDTLPRSGDKNVLAHRTEVLSSTFICAGSLPRRRATPSSIPRAQKFTKSP